MDYLAFPPILFFFFPLIFIAVRHSLGEDGLEMYGQNSKECLFDKPATPIDLNIIYK